MVTFKEARSLVLAELKRQWGDTPGTPVTLRHGFEDDKYWNVVAGPREFLIGRDDTYALFDAPVWLVDKKTGKITQASVIEDDGTIGKMTPVTAK